MSDDTFFIEQDIERLKRGNKAINTSLASLSQQIVGTTIVNGDTIGDIYITNNLTTLGSGLITLA